MPIKVTITDDHPMVIGGIKNMLDQSSDIELLSTFTDGAMLLDGLKTAQPDVLLLDICMPGQQGNELAGIITKMYPDIRILALTSHDASYHVMDMLQHGCLAHFALALAPGPRWGQVGCGALLLFGVLEVAGNAQRTLHLRPGLLHDHHI